MARRICEGAKLTTRSSPRRIGRQEADSLFQAIQATKIKAPTTDCLSPIGEELLLKGLHQVVPGEFYVAATRPPAVYRGNPFLIEVGLAYGGGVNVQKVSYEILAELLSQTDARTLRQFVINTFDGLGARGSGSHHQTVGHGDTSIARETKNQGHPAAARGHAERQHFGRAGNAGTAVPPTVFHCNSNQPLARSLSPL